MIERLAEEDVRLVWHLAAAAVQQMELLPTDHPGRAGLRAAAAHAAAAGEELVRRDVI
jgi:hypothetical protein